MKIIACVLIIFLARPTFAQSSIYLSLGAGQALETHTETISTGSALSTSVQTEDDDKNSGYFEIEAGIRELKHSLGIIYSSFDYKYESGPPNDKMQQLLLVFKYNLNLPDYNLKLWAAPALGISKISLGQKTTESSGFRFEFQDETKTSLLLHARIGADYYFLGPWFLSFSLTYNWSKHDFLINVSRISDSSSIGQVNTELTRTWLNWTTAIGYRF